MTGTEVLQLAAGLMHETDTDKYEDLALLWLKVIVAECFEVANRRREYDGIDTYRTVPTVTDLDEDLPYDDVLVAKAFPYGLVCKLFVEEMDLATLGMYEQKYANAVNECDRAICEYVLDDTVLWDFSETSDTDI